MKATLSTLLCALALVLANGCFAPSPRPLEWVDYHAGTARIATPPDGKVLVNFHRTDCRDYMYAFAVFDSKGNFLADLPVNCQFQHTCDPGEQVFMGWLMHGPVSVIRADLAADKVYDIYVREGPWERPRLVPLHKQDEVRARVPQWESSSQVVTLKKLPRVANTEAKAQPKIAQIRADFLGGPKSGRVLMLAKEDCR